MIAVCPPLLDYGNAPMDITNNGPGYEFHLKRVDMESKVMPTQSA